LELTFISHFMYLINYFDTILRKNSRHLKNANNKVYHSVSIYKMLTKRSIFIVLL